MDLKFEETDQHNAIFKVFVKSGNGSKIWGNWPKIWGNRSTKLYDNLVGDHYYCPQEWFN